MELHQHTPAASQSPLGAAAAALPPGPDADLHAGALGALSEALAEIGDRWSLLVAAVLLEGPLRFGELQERVTGIAPNVLTQRLRRLEERGVVLSQPYCERPPRYLYELTGPGRELAGALRLLAGWGARHGRAEDSDLPRHQACGAALEARWYCPVCRETVGEPGADGGPELYYV